MMNQELINILSKYNIRVDEAMPYLLSLYYGYNPSYIPKELIKKIHISKIVEFDFSMKVIHWNIPLFEEQETEFGWVKTEYLELFRPLGKATNLKESIIRMKSLFAKHPEIRKDEILGATRMYITNTDNKFVRLPHYFIEKGVGVSKTNDILEWINKYREYTEVTEETNHFNRLL